MTITIRDARQDDADTIAAFNARMAVETENRELDRALLQPGVTAILGDVSKGRYWVAEVDGAIAGQLAVTYEWSDWRNGTLWWIQSVFVPKEFRRLGVFTALYRHVEMLARETADCCGLRLYVEGQNTRAQETYAALGMTHPGYHVMEIDFRKESS